MANYILRRSNIDRSLLSGNGSSFTDEYAMANSELCLTEETQEDGEGRNHKLYRLHARDPHTIEMALAYDIICPFCKCAKLKKVTRCRNSHDLGLYKCPVCDNK